MHIHKKIRQACSSARCCLRAHGRSFVIATITGMFFGVGIGSAIQRNTQTLESWLLRTPHVEHRVRVTYPTTKEKKTTAKKRPRNAASRSSVQSATDARRTSFRSSLSSIASLPSQSSVPSPSSASSLHTDERTGSAFPPFLSATFPVRKVPNWGVMTSAKEWDRSFTQMTSEDFVPIPEYDLPMLTVPLKTILKDREENAPLLTAKLFYSTRHFAAYDLDAPEFSAIHPGVDLKLAPGTPVGAIGGGRVHAVRMDQKGLGLHVLVEHRIEGEAFYSIYGHLAATYVKKGETVLPGQSIGTVGSTGYTTAPHLHLQVDRGAPNEAAHVVYWPKKIPSRAEAYEFTLNPLEFISQYQNFSEVAKGEGTRRVR